MDIVTYALLRRQLSLKQDAITEDNKLNFDYIYGADASKIGLSADVPSDVNVGHVEIGETLFAGTTLQQAMNEIFIGKQGEIVAYIGSIDNLINIEYFKDVPPSELISNAVPYTLDGSPVKWRPLSQDSAYYILIKEGYKPEKAEEPDPFNPSNPPIIDTYEDITASESSPTPWKLSLSQYKHEPVIIEGSTYKVYGTYSKSWDVDSNWINMYFVKED